MSDAPILYRPVGPVRCPRCKADVRDAPPGEHACICGAREGEAPPAVKRGRGRPSAKALAAERDALLVEVDRLRARAAIWKRLATCLRAQRDMERIKRGLDGSGLR